MRANLSHILICCSIAITGAIDFIDFIEQRVQLGLAFSLVLARIQWRAATAIAVCHSCAF
jgi:hypothetical protein